jgi:hypothetical protein
MPVTVLQIGKVRVPMAHGGVTVLVRMRIGHSAIMAVQMVIVVHVTVLML